MKNKVTKALFKFFVFPLIAVLMLWLLPVSSVFGEGTSGSNIKELEEAVESAKKILEEAKEALDTANQVLIETQAKADEANKILSEAESSLQEAEARLADANVKVSEAKAALENASEGDDVESLQANLSSAEEELQAAQKAYDDAEAALEVAKANVEQAQQELEQAKLAVDEATGNLESAQKAYDDAVAALEEAQKNLAENDDNQNGDQNNSNSDDNDGNNDDGSNNEGGGENNGGSNSNENLTLLGVNSGTFGQEDPKINPSITTDKDDYHPEETVVISGSGFYPDTEYTIRVTRPDGAKDSSNVTSDGNGSFTYTYQLDGITGEYLVEAIDSEGSALASCKFTDTATCDDTRVDLHSDHQGADSSTFNEETGNNGGITKPGVVWHFILNGLSKDTPPATLYISFEGAKSSTVTASNGGKTQHFWVWTPTDDKLVSGQVYALVDSCA
ncbi:MAG: hypothetical protein H5T85_07940, partial [Actinobacteria bacterium]|nr:hypothetical protein [Actinomycetota bacterium]